MKASGTRDDISASALYLGLAPRTLSSTSNIDLFKLCYKMMAGSSSGRRPSAPLIDLVFISALTMLNFF